MKFDEKERWAAAFARARAADRADQIEFLRHLLAEGKLEPEEQARLKALNHADDEASAQTA